MATSSGIITSYLETFDDEKVKLRFNDALSALFKTTATILNHTLNYYLEALEQADEVLIGKLSKDQKIILKRKLHITYLLLLKHNDANEKYRDQLIRCDELIDYIDLNNTDKKTIEALEQEQAYPGKPISYCGIQAGQWMGARILDVISNKTTTVIEWMSAINEKRLYWVWGGGLLRTVLSLLPADFYNAMNAKNVASAPSRFTGYMSWTLYFARFALNSFLLLKDTFAPSLTENELLLGKMAYWERFKTQWDIRKFTLLNDSIWGIANMVCFFWFKGSDGDALTLGLLSFDLFITLWDFEEQKTLHNKKMLDYVTQIQKLQMESDQIEASGVPIADTVRLEIKKLEKEKLKCQKDWDNKKLGLVSNIAYALGLLIAFALLTMPFMPIAAPTLLIIGVIGSILCFALTVIYNTVKGGLEIRAASLSAKEAKNDLKDKIADFEKLMVNDPNLDNKDKIFLFLEIKQLMAESDYQKQMVLYQTMHLVRNIIIQSMIPALMFLSLVFLPMGIGFAVLAAALVLAVVTNIIIEKTFKPEEVKFPEFDNDEYEQFSKNPNMWSKKPKSLTLFGESKEPIREADEIPLLNKDGSPSN